MQATILDQSPEWEGYYFTFLEGWKMGMNPPGEVYINDARIDKERHAKLVKKTLSYLNRYKIAKQKE